MIKSKPQQGKNLFSSFVFINIQQVNKYSITSIYFTGRCAALFTFPRDCGPQVKFFVPLFTVAPTRALLRASPEVAETLF